MDPKVLQDCAQRLIETAQTIRSSMGTSGNSAAATQGSVQATSTTTTNTTCQTGQPAATSNLRPNSSVNSSALSEHNRIFGYRPPSAVARSIPGKKRSRTTVGSRPKYFKPSATWSRAFICLAERGQNHVPSTTERINLLLAGLGEKKIQFPSEGNAAEVHESIMDAFPSLENGGGYEILRSGDGRQKELILIPMPATGFSVSYLKSVLGQAKGYLRPLQKDIFYAHAQGDNKVNESSNCPTVNCVNCHALISMNEIKDHQSVCGGGSSQSVHDDHQKTNEETKPSNNNTGPGVLDDLRQLFPDTPVSQIENALTEAKGDSNQAADLLMTEINPADKCNVDNDDSDEELMQSVWNTLGIRSNRENKTSSASNEKDISLSSIINKLGRKLTGQEVKIQIEQRNVLLDALPIYKNPKFDPRCPLRVSFSEQPAVDIGGPKREFFTRLFEEIAGGSGGSVPTLFEGPEGRLMPVYSSSMLYSGIMTAVGKMIAHSIGQCGVGFPYLSPLCYWYLVTADVQKAIGYANVTDIRDFEVSDLVKRLLNTKAEDMAALGDDPSIIALLSDAGCNERPSIDNRQLLVESLMLHTTLSKRKVILDQLRKGLECLNVLGEMTERPLLFQSLFTASAEDVSPSQVMRCLTFSVEHASCSSKGYLQHFIEESTQKDLQLFLRFTTGSTAIPLGPGKISVSFDALDGTIFASTCLLELHMPPSFSSYEEFKAALSVATAVDPVQCFNSI